MNVHIQLGMLNINKYIDSIGINLQSMISHTQAFLGKR